MVIIPFHCYPKKIQIFFFLNKKGLSIFFSATHHQNDPSPYGVDGIHGRHLLFSTWYQRKGKNTLDP